MCRLSVNINKVALIRNSRGTNLPDLSSFAKDCEAFGAEGITVHPRPDERHIRFSDLAILKEIVTTEFNIEGYPSEKFIHEVLKVKPNQVTLVPDPPEALTSNTGWDTKSQLHFLREVVSRFKDAGIRVSIFHNPDTSLLEYTVQTGTDRIELYTGKYALMYPIDKYQALEAHVLTAQMAHDLGIEINAGHDLNLQNLKDYFLAIPMLSEVSIGHALICDSIYFGLENTIRMYKNLLKTY